MAHGHFHAELRQLRTMLAGPMTDADLINRFVEKRDEAAFAVLVRRHGSLVLHVCRSVLRQDADADDAFQATFLVLARKAASFRKGTSLASWLHGVAYRCSMNLRKSAMRRQAREKAAAGGRPSESSVSDAAWNDLQACLHEEVQRLPTSVRAAFVLCVLEDKGRVEAAQALGCPEGTLASRLARARKILQKRLSARGVTLSAALSSAAIATGAASAALVHQTTMAALAFTAGSAAGAVSAQALSVAQGVLRGLVLTKAKLGAMLMFAVLLGGIVGGSLVAQSGGPEVPAKKVVAPNPVPQAENDKPEAIREKQAHADSRGDELPEAALVRLGSAHMRHGRSIYRSELSPDGKLLATAGQFSLIVWDLESGTEKYRFPFGRTVAEGEAGLAFSPDGSHLAYIRNAIFGCICDLRTGKEIHRIELPGKDTRKVEDHLYGECRFANDGKDLLYVTHSALHRYNLDSKRIVESIPAKDVQVLSPDGKTYVRFERTELIPTEIATGKVLARIETVGRISAHEVIYAPDGKSIAVVHDSREIQQRALPGGKILASFPLPNEPDAALRASGGRRSYRPQFSADGRTLTVGTTHGSQRFAVRWDVASGKELPALVSHGFAIKGVHVLPDGRTIVTTSWDGLIRKWDSATAKMTPVPDSYVGHAYAAFSEDGRFAAIGDLRGRVDLRDARDGKIVRVLQQEGKPPARFAFAPDGKSLAMLEASGTVRFWQIPSGEAGPVWESKQAADKGSGYQIRFSPDGRLLSTSDSLRGLRALETATGRVLWKDPQNDVAAFSADGTTLISGDRRGPALSLRDAKTGATKSRIQLAPAEDWLNGCTEIVVSHDGRNLATVFGGGCLSLCDARTCRETRKLVFDGMPGSNPRAEDTEERPEDVNTAAFSADGHWLASGNIWGGITIWDVAAGEEVLRLPGHDAEVVALAFDPDGRRLNSFGLDGQGYRWKLEPKFADGRRASFADIWDALHHAKPADAYGAQWRMIADPKGSVAFLRDRLKPTSAPDAGKIRKWIADLDSDVFAVRETASRELSKVGEPAQTPIQEALKKDMSAETNRRLTQILVSTLETVRGSETSTARRSWFWSGSVRRRLAACWKRCHAGRRERARPRRRLKCSSGSKRLYRGKAF